VIVCVCAPLDQRYDELALAVNVTVPELQKVVAPEAVIVGVGIALIVTSAETLLTHPDTFVTVYVMVARPADTPVTTPDADTVATAAFEVDHAPPIVALSSVVFAPTHNVVAPVKEATVGIALIVTVAVWVLVQPFTFVTL
jgi:hypothetical protein